MKTDGTGVKYNNYVLEWIREIKKAQDRGRRARQFLNTWKGREQRLSVMVQKNLAKRAGGEESEFQVTNVTEIQVNPWEPLV